MTKFADNHGSGQDYSGVTLEQMWASLSQPDNLTWPQIAAWDTMAQVCADQAEQLHRSLSSLSQTWPPLPNSAAEVFAQRVAQLINSMRRDAADAQNMQPVLVSISSELDVAKARMQSLMDQRQQFLAIEQAKTKFGTPEFNTTDAATRDLADQPLPNGWRDDLHAQGTVVMRTADDNLATLTARMPTLTSDRDAFIDATHLKQPPIRNETPSPMPANQVAIDQAIGQTLGAGRVMPLPPTAAPVLNGGPQLAGGPPRFPENPDQFQSMPVGAFAEGPSPMIGSPLISPVGPSVIDGPVRAPGGSSETVNEASSSGLHGGQEPAGSVRSATAGLPVASALGGRPGQASRTSTIRPGGRAALWASQRARNKSNPNDPWSVRNGVPSVIEPPEPVDHDPGPGVIGIDR